MTFRKRQLLGWSLLAAVAAAGAFWLLKIDYSKHLSVDVLDLIPVDERSPELTLVRSLASQSEARTMLFELTGPDGKAAPGGAQSRFARLLAANPAFDQAVAIGDTAPFDALGRELFNQRFALLFPIWLDERRAAYASSGGAPAGFSEWLAHDTVAALSRFLATPEAPAFQDMVPRDPLLLMPGAVDRTKEGLALAQPATARSSTLVWARLAASPLSEAGQSPAFAAIQQAAALSRRDFPGLNIAYTGINRFAAASRDRIQKEVAWLNALSLAAVLAVALTFLRGAHRGLHLIPVLAFSVLGAWVGATLTFDRLHIIVLVVGSMLTGVSIDYGFYLFMQPPLRPGEEYWDKVRRLAKPLLAGCLTTVAGFLLLLFSELPFIRQLGVFVAAGLLSALASAVVYFSTVHNPYLEARAFRLGPGLAPQSRRSLRRLLIVAWIAAMPGLALLKWSDDIRELEIPSPELTREDTRIRALFGEQTEETVYLTYGGSVSEARTSLQQFEAWLHAAGTRTRTVGLGGVVPTRTACEQAVRFGAEHPEFPGQLRAALDTAGYDAGAFEPFFQDYARDVPRALETDPSAALAAVQAKLTGPIGLLLHTGRPLSWFVTIAQAAPDGAPPPGTHTVSANQLQSLNQLFGRYRKSALWLSLAGLAIVGIGVLLSYGIRDGVRIFAIPCGACLGLFGLFGWIGHPLNLFHLLGAFLGVCLTHNYSIFSATSAYRREPPPVSVRLSALTAAASFGVLALSGIPVVRGLGTTVASMVVVALIAIEFEHLAGLGKAR